jgi:hypothetical protein
MYSDYLPLKDAVIMDNLRLLSLSNDLDFPFGYLSDYLTPFGVPWNRSNIHENVPVLLLLYSVYNNYELVFEEDGRVSAKDDLVEHDRVFYWLTSWVRLPNFPWMKDAYRNLMAARDEEFLKETFPLLLTAIECAVYNDTIIHSTKLRDFYHSSEIITQRIASLLNSLGISSVFDSDWQFVSLAKYLSKDIVYTANVGSPENGSIIPIMDAVLLKAFSTPGSHITYPFGIEGKSEAVVLYGDGRYGCGDDRSMKEILEQGRRLSSGFIIYVTEFDDVVWGKDYLARRNLCRIDSDGYHFFFVFDLRRTHDTVEYHYWTVSDRDIVQAVPYTEIQMNENCLNIEAYIHDKVEDGMTLVRLSELCLPPESMKDFDSPEPARLEDMMPTYSMSSLLNVICSPLFRPTKGKYNHTISQGSHPGTFLHIGRQGCSGIRECITRCDVPYQIDGEVRLSLPVDESKVSAEYLACVLMGYRPFGELISKCYYSRLFRRYKVAVTLDKAEQSKFVKSILAHCRDVVNSDGVYDVVCVGQNLSSEKVRNQLEGWNLTVQAPLESVLDEGGLKDFLSDKDRAKTVNAIIVDPSADATGTRLKGLRRALALGMEKDIPVFVFSNLPQETLEEDLDEEEFEYCRNGRLFAAEEEDSLRKLATALRDDLDKNGTLETQLQARFSREFSAAKKVEALFGEKVPEKLTRFLISPNQSLNDLRVSLEALLKTVADAIAPGTDLGKTKGGWLAKFFLTGAREDKEVTRKFYTLDGKLMEKTLATAVDFLYQILNGASHGDSAEEGNELNVLSYISESGTSNLAVSAVHIYMDFIVWLADTGGQFSAVCSARDSRDEIIPDNLTGILRCAGRNEYYIETPTDRYGNIHIVFSKGGPIAVGSSVRVLAMSEETRLRKSYRWFATRWESCPDNESGRKRERIPSTA